MTKEQARAEADRRWGNADAGVHGAVCLRRKSTAERYLVGYQQMGNGDARSHPERAFSRAMGTIRAPHPSEGCTLMASKPRGEEP